MNIDKNGRFLPIPISGRKFGRLLVVHEVEKGVWLCRCDCGTECRKKKAYLLDGGTSSCGCLRVELAASRTRSHSKSHTVEYKAWAAMKARCQNERHADWRKYGGRGIKVCERWQSFENFYADMGSRPSGGALDRIDNDKGYEPGNCRWTSYTQNNRNRRSNVNVTINGVTKCLGEWAKDVGLWPSTIRGRLKRGESGEQLLRPGRG